MYCFLTNKILFKYKVRLTLRLRGEDPSLVAFKAKIPAELGSVEWRGTCLTLLAVSGLLLFELAFVAVFAGLSRHRGDASDPHYHVVGYEPSGL